MYKLDISVDNREAAAIAARRRREEERKERFFDAKKRTLNVDLDALERQIRERNLRKEQERLRDEAYQKMLLRNDKLACVLEEREKADRQQVLRELAEYWREHQKPQFRKEYDLNDPNYTKKAGLTTDDSKIGISSLRNFAGEDQNRRARSCQQVNQIREWTQRQLAEKAQAEQAQKIAERLFYLQTREMDERACRLAEAEEQARKAIHEATIRYNEALARERAFKNKIKKDIEEADNAAEIANSVFGDMLSENPSQAISGFGPGRVLPGRFKGLSPEQLKLIREQQLQQIEERQCLQGEELRREQQWAEQTVKGAKLGELLDRKYQNLRNLQKKKLVEENLNLAQQHASKERELEKERRNLITEDFFKQFNTSTR